MPCDLLLHKKYTRKYTQVLCARAGLTYLTNIFDKIFFEVKFATQKTKSKLKIDKCKNQVTIPKSVTGGEVEKSIDVYGQQKVLENYVEHENKPCLAPLFIQ